MADPKGLLVVPVGFRSNGSLHAFEMDNSDRLKISPFNPSAWEKRVSVVQTTISVGAGNTNVTSAAVPASKLWTIQAIAGFHSDPVVRTLTTSIVNSLSGQAIPANFGVGVAGFTLVQGLQTYILDAGDYMTVDVQALAVGQTAFLTFWGYETSKP